MEKETPFSHLEQHREEIFSWGQLFFRTAELGFQEYSTSAHITALLDQWQIPYEKNIAMTGVCARLGTEGYHIAFVSDMDALPRQSGIGNVHSCGHSIQTVLALSMLKVLKETGLPEKTGCRISFFFTPAEEFIDFAFRDELIAQSKLQYRSGKQNMIAQGYFDDVDCVLSAHANGEKDTLFDIQSTLTGFQAKKAVFLGKSAHSGAAPHLGRNALHGAVLCQNALAFLKEHFPPEAGLRLHPVLTESSGTVNIIPDRAVLETYLRANDTDTLLRAADEADNCARHCAAALSLECRIETTPGYLPLRQSPPLNHILRENILLHCDESALLENVVSGASGDIGDLSFLLPTIQMGFSGIEGQFHHDAFTIRDPENCYLRTAKVLLGLCFDLMTHPKLRVFPENFAEKKSRWLQITQKQANHE